MSDNNSMEQEAREQAAKEMAPLRANIEKLLQDPKYSGLTVFVENGMWSEPHVAQAYMLLYFPAELDENGDEIDLGPEVGALITEFTQKIGDIVAEYEDGMSGECEVNADEDTYDLPDEFQSVTLPDGSVHTFAAESSVVSVTCRVEM